MDQTRQNSGLAASSEEGAMTLRSRLLARLRNEDEDVAPRLPVKRSGGDGSVKAGVARRLASSHLFGRTGGTRGVAAGAVQGPGDGSAALAVKAGQRVVVKAFVARHGGPRGASDPGKAIASHVRYLARDGVGADGSEPTFFGAEGALERESVKEATGAWAEDRHHFRLIISPEHGDRIDDLQSYVRDVMGDVAKKLNEPRLAWVGICHFDTDQPHAHVMIRGRRADGRTLVMPRRVISHTIRERAEARAQMLLGDQSRDEAERGLFARTKADRWTDIDTKMATLAERNGGLLAGGELARRDTFGAVIRGRVAHLEKLGLAMRQAGGGVRFAADMKARLDSLQRGRDEIRNHWDRTRAEALKRLQHGPKATERPSSEKSAVVEADQPSRAFPDPRSDRLIQADRILADRARSSAAPQRFDPETEQHLSQRAAHLIATRAARAQNHGVAFAPDHWNRLERNELQAAAREQLSLNRTDIAIQPSVSEGKVMGHVNTVMGRFAVVDRGVSLAAVREMPGQELAVGAVLGAGLSR
jgi:hypothetical protein